MRKLLTRVVEKVWGVEQLPFAINYRGGEKVGEIWFEPPPEIPNVLVKHIFTSEKLSVQVHPDDHQAKSLGLGLVGKNECWLITHAEANAQIAVGFEHTLTRDEIRQASISGSIEDLLTWHQVRPGDFFYIPAGTVHAIGAGVGLVEVQQNSDITFRLFDYGRPRQIHLDDGLRVVQGEPYPQGLMMNTEGRNGAVELTSNVHFRATLMIGELGELDVDSLLVPIAGSLHDGKTSASVGECVLACPLDQITVEAGSKTIVVHSAS